MKSLKYNLLLVLAAFIWGAAFSAQSAGMDYLGPFTFNAIRFIIGSLVLIPVIVLIDKKKLKNGEKVSTFKDNLKAGVLCGIILCTATSFQQIGIIYTSAGKAGFITALYVIMVPIVGIFFGKKNRLLLWISAAMAVCGMYLLTLSGGFGINKGDVLVFICSIVFTLHILVIDKYAPSLDGVKISSIQFMTSGVICAVIVPFTEKVTLSSVWDCRIPILYAGILSCGVAYTLQIVGQQKTQPVVASLLLSLESVFSVITAWLFLGESLTGREIIGCVIVFIAIILAQITDLPVFSKKKG